MAPPLTFNFSVSRCSWAITASDGKNGNPGIQCATCDSNVSSHTGHRRNCYQIIGFGPILIIREPTTSIVVGDVVIATIEGLSVNGNHPLQNAWIAGNVPQCGYCQPGQIMTAAALLAHIQHPSDDDIDQVMSGVLCRCGTYQRIRAAIHQAAAGGVS